MLSVFFIEYQKVCLTERAVARPRPLDGPDVIEDGKLGVVTADWNRLIPPGSGLQGALEYFQGRVVVAMTRAAYAAFDAGGGERTKIVGVVIQPAAIRLMEACRGGLPSLQDLGEGR